MKISIDIDGVLSNFTAGVVKAANELWPGKLPLDYVPNNWGYTDVFTADEFKEVFRFLKTVPYFWEDSPEYEENVSSLQNFLSANQAADVYYITSRFPTTGPSVLRQSSFWLRVKGVLPECRSSVIAIAKPTAKAGFIKDLEIDFSIDDYAPTVEECQIEGHKAFVLDRPWNRYAAELPRVYSLQEYLNIIEGENSERDINGNSKV